MIDWISSALHCMSICHCMSKVIGHRGRANFYGPPEIDHQRKISVFGDHYLNFCPNQATYCHSSFVFHSRENHHFSGSFSHSKTTIDRVVFRKEFDVL